MIVLPLIFLVACEASKPDVGDDTETSGVTPEMDVPELSLNEFLASNRTVYEDPDYVGEFDDWVEIYNGGSETVELAGLYLTDDLETPTKFALPEDRSMEPGGFLLIWCDDQPEQGPTHAPYKLNRKEDFLAIFLVDGGNDPIRLDAVEFKDQAQDVSMGRVPDGGAEWKSLERASPGASNG